MVRSEIGLRGKKWSGVKSVCGVGGEPGVEWQPKNGSGVGSGWGPGGEGYSPKNCLEWGLAFVGGCAAVGGALSEYNGFECDFPLPTKILPNYWGPSETYQNGGG